MAAVAAALVYVFTPATSATKTAPAKEAKLVAAAPVVQAPAPASSNVIARQVEAREIIGSAWSDKLPPEFAEFHDWTGKYIAGAPAARNAQLAEGVELAKERRAVLARLIREDPKQALALAVPMVVRQQLPAEIVAQLEERVSTRGALSVLAVTAQPGQTVAEPIWRSATVGSEQYRTYVYGRRATQATLSTTSITGIALDKVAAVSESPLRVLEAGEVADGRTVDNVCGVSGALTPVKAGAGFNGTTFAADTSTAVEYNGKIQLLCHSEHVEALEAKLIASEDDLVGTSGEGPPPFDYNWTHGTKTVLLIRVDFSDATGGIASDTAAVNMFNAANGVRDFYEKCSYLGTTLKVDPFVSGVSPNITPVLRMPKSKATYAAENNSLAFLQDAYVVARAAGYEPNNFDRPGVIYAGIYGFSGQAYVGSTGFWLQTTAVGVANHEIGHNYGLWHANLWKVTDGNPVSATGSSLEYGDSFDTMGSTSGEFSHWAKLILQWMPEASITVARTSGTYRIYRMDGGSGTNQANVRALKIVRNPTINYWIGYRRGSGNASLNGGAYVLWGMSGHPEGQLLDMQTPGNNTVDAGLPIGTTFNDSVAGIAIQPVAQGGTGANEYLDVQVTLQPRIQWTQTNVTADKVSGTARVVLTRTSSSVGAVSVNYSTTPGTATTPADYTTSSGTVNWADGDITPKTIAIPLVTGAAAGTRTFTVNLSGITGATLNGSATTTVSIADPGFRDTFYGSSYPFSPVNKVLPLGDGTAMVGGSFTYLYNTDLAAYYPHRGVGLVDANGSADSVFASGVGADTGTVFDLARQPDGKIIAVGNFGSYNGTARHGVVRLMPDGTVDATFNPGTGPNTNATVYALQLQPDGKILIGGDFTSYNGTAREYLARLNSDGSLDATFVGPDFIGTTSWSVRSLALQAGGKLLVGGAFYLNSSSPFKGSLCQVLPSGALDPAFLGVIDGTYVGGAPAIVAKVVVQPDGQILVAGNFTKFNGATRGGLARLTSTGALDVTFTPTISAGGSCNTVFLQPDGKILVGGVFSSFNGTAAANLARISSSGTFDTAFGASAGPGGAVYDVAQQVDASTLVGSAYVNYQGASRALSRIVTGGASPSGSVQFSAPTASGSQGTPVSLTVARTGGSLGALTVGYSTVPSSAHFTPASGVLTWVDGDTSSKTITVPLTFGFLSGATETFTVNLGSPVLGGGLLGLAQQAVITINPAFPPPAIAGDINGDGLADILWENTTTGARGLWTMNGTTFTSWIDVGIISTDLRIAGTGDFNGDGKMDIIWENTVTGKRVIWFMNGTTFISSFSLGIVTTDWRIAAVADFNHDGKPDILWENTVSGDRGFWLMNGTAFSSWVDIGVVSTDWRIAGTGDFNADNKPDIVWENTTSGDRCFWLMNDTAFSSWVDIGILSTNWRIAGVADFNHDGQPDLLWENTLSGDRGFWIMNGTAFSSWVDIGIVTTDWRIAP